MGRHPKRNIPQCERCGGSGTGHEFSIFSEYGFGTYCVPCEAVIKQAAKAVREYEGMRKRDKGGAS